MKFLEQLTLVMDALEDSGCYDPTDRFFYDLLTDALGNRERVQVQTLVGVIPALPAMTLPTRNSHQIQRLRKRFTRRMEAQNRQILDWRVRGSGNSRRGLVSIVAPDKLARIFGTLFDENAFLSPHGLRTLSRRHSTPYQVPGVPGATIEYEPAESHTAMYGGNSNWRGPVWFPINYLVIRALLQYDQFFGPEFTIEYPTGSGQQLSLRDIAGDLSDRPISIWLPCLDGRRPVYGGVELMQTDPAWKDKPVVLRVLHGDNGAGLGAMHQTGWTALVADLLLDPPRRVRRMVFYDDASIAPDLTDIAAGPAG